MDAAIAKSVRLARRKNYAGAIKLLESEVLLHRDSWLYAYVLGLCYLKSGDAGSAYGLLRRASSIAEQKTEPLCALAALHLMRGESAKAVSFYLNIKDLDPENALAKRGLALLQRYAGREDSPVWKDAAKTEKLIPKFPTVPLSTKTIVLCLTLAILAALVAGAANLYARGLIHLPKLEKLERAGLDVSALSSSEKNAPVESPALFASVRYVLSAKEVLDAYEKGRGFFNKGRDDAARVEMNRILESNAAAAVKNKARLLSSFMTAPDFTNLTEHFSYSEVAAAPFLYKDCTILWRGMAVNLEAGDASTVFDLLVGYDTRSRLEGTVRVSFDYALRINTEKPLEVLARVVPPAEDGKESFELAGAAVHELSGK